MASRLPPVSSPPWSTTTKLVVTLVIMVLLAATATRIGGSIWSAILVAVLLAYLLSPVVTFFERRLPVVLGRDVRRSLAALLTFVVVIGAFSLIIGLIVPATVDQSRQFAADLPDLVSTTGEDIEQMLRKPIRLGGTTLVPWNELEKALASGDQDGAGDGLSGSLQGAVVSLATPALNVLGSAVSFLATTLFVLVMLFYLMRDGPQFVEYLVATIPEAYRGDALRLMRELGHIWNAYLRGQLMLSTAVGVMTYSIALFLGLPQPLVLGLIAGLLELIPGIGPTLAAIPAMLFALTTSSATIPGLEAGLFYAFVVALAYMSIQQLEALFLVPRILGGSLDLHPFVVILSILIGASLAGLLGMILAAPSAATLRLLGRYLRGKLLDEELFPTMPPQGVQQRALVYRLMRFWLSKRFPVMPSESLEDRQPLTSDLFAEPGERSDASRWSV